jgi:hypothetical protein
MHNFLHPTGYYLIWHNGYVQWVELKIEPQNTTSLTSVLFRTHTHTHTHTDTHTDTHTHTHTDTQTHRYTDTHTQTHAHRHTHTHRHNCIFPPAIAQSQPTHYSMSAGDQVAAEGATVRPYRNHKLRTVCVGCDCVTVSGNVRFRQ